MMTGEDPHGRHGWDCELKVLTLTRITIKDGPHS